MERLSHHGGNRFEEDYSSDAAHAGEHGSLCKYAMWPEAAAAYRMQLIECGVSVRLIWQLSVGICRVWLSSRN